MKVRTNVARRSNCLFFVLALWWRRACKWDFGTIKFRRSRNTTWWCPHFLYRHRKTHLIHYCPVDPVIRKLAPVVFVGQVRWGDRAPGTAHAVNTTPERGIGDLA